MGLDFLILAIQTLGATLTTYSLINLMGIGIDLLYIVRYLLNPKVRQRRREVKRFIYGAIEDRISLILKILGINNTYNSNIGTPKVFLNLREADRPGGRYFWGHYLITLDVPKKLKDILPVLDHELVHYVQDVLNVVGPRWYLEGMASCVELKLHGKSRGYVKELHKFMKLVSP